MSKWADAVEQFGKQVEEFLRAAWPKIGRPPEVAGVPESRVKKLWQDVVGPLTAVKMRSQAAGAVGQAVAKLEEIRSPVRIQAVWGKQLAELAAGLDLPESGPAGKGEVT